MPKRLALLTAAAAIALTACASVQAQTAADPNDTSVIAIGRGLIKPEQNSEAWLYGSAEAQIALRQGWDSIAAYGEYVAQNRPTQQVFLTAFTATDTGEISTPVFRSCGDRPMAAVFDADETVIWNMGVTRYQSERSAGYDPKIWDNWEETGADKVVAVPGAVAAFDRLRKAGLTIIINTNRVTQWAAPTADALRHAGLGEFQHGSTLYLKGDSLQPGQSPSSAKDGRRAAISQQYCIVILAGDNLGDISDAFNDKALTQPQRRTRVNSPAFDRLWGKGWFVLPNPVYGSQWEGASFDDIYPADTRWAPTIQP